MLTTRPIISGHRTYELAGHWNGDHHNGVPILVLTHDVPDEPPPGTSASSPTPSNAGECWVGMGAGILFGTSRARPPRRQSIASPASAFAANLSSSLTFQTS